MMKINDVTLKGVRMGDGFINNLLIPPPIKEFVENKSPAEHGKTVLFGNVFFDERDVVLTFEIQGSSRSDYISKYKALMAELAKGQVRLHVPEISDDIYNLIYQKASSFAINRAGTFSKISVKFNEPNPNNRI